MSGRTTYFVDTNVVLRFFLQDHDVHSPLATEFFARFAAGEFDIVVSDSVIFESVFVMEGKTYKVSREDIVEYLTKLLSNEGIQIMGVVDFASVFELYLKLPVLSFADCAHAVLSLKMPSRSIVSFDLDYPLVEGLKHIDLTSSGTK